MSIPIQTFLTFFFERFADVLGVSGLGTGVSKIASNVDSGIVGVDISNSIDLGDPVSSINTFLLDLRFQLRSK